MHECKRTRRATSRLAAICFLAAALASFGSPAAEAQSQAGSEAASAAMASGSAVVAAGSVEILRGAASLTVASIETSARGAQLVLRPVTAGASNAAQVSANVTIEISLAAWRAAKAASRATGQVLEDSLMKAGTVIQTVVLHGAHTSRDVGLLLTYGSVVLAVVAHEGLENLLGHSVHGC